MENLAFSLSASNLSTRADGITHDTTLSGRSEQASVGAGLLDTWVRASLWFLNLKNCVFGFEVLHEAAHVPPARSRIGSRRYDLPSHNDESRNHKRDDGRGLKPGGSQQELAFDLVRWP